MTLENILITCAIGIIAGWLASLIVKGGGSGILRDLIIGLVGALIGGWLLPRIGLTLPGGPYVVAIITALIGAVILLAIVRLVTKKA